MTADPMPHGSAGSAEPAQIPEHIIVLLLEGAQRFLARAIDAIQRGDGVLRDRALKRIKPILKELDSRLNHEQGGELVGNLIRIYDWWDREISDAGAHADVDRLQGISTQMGEIRRAWWSAIGTRVKRLKPCG